MPLTLIEAIATVMRDCAADQVPVLTNVEVKRLVEESAHATVWAPGTAYAYNDRVIPTVRNGFFYTVVEAGTSGATEPQNWPRHYGSTFTDGTVLWRAYTPDWIDLYDTRTATWLAWRMKAARASAYVNTSMDGQTTADSDIYAHCVAMSTLWAPVGVA